MDKLKASVKRVVGQPDNEVKTVSVKQWALGVIPEPKQGLIDYVTSLFPILGWIWRYNLGWLSGDLVAGITVGIVVVPQSMSYAQIATLPTQYGLYSAFIGVFLYCFFATSKDVSIGPVAVMSLTTSQIIKAVNDAHPGVWEGHIIATTVSFVCGFIVLGIGLLRIGWLVEFIPAPAVSGFMTGSAINIVAGQVPGLLGESGFDTRAATYKVIINTLKNLPGAKLDAAFGVPALFALYAIRIFFDQLTKRYPHRARTFFFISILRNGFVIVILTIASWLYCRDRRSAKGTYPIKILLTVPRGLQGVGVPQIDRSLVQALAGQLPVATIILLLEHIAISKSFGRVNGYKINPNQELIAIGVTNVIGSFFSAYPATGSFSRSALKSKCGVRTPLAGIFTGIVVIVALYGLTPAFFWIPSAGLSAIIIHAVANLVATPAQAYQFWRVSPLEFVIWAAAVLVTVFSTIENGIYTSIIASAVLLLVRIARPRGKFLGRVSLGADAAQRLGRDIYAPLKQDSGGDNGRVRVDPPMPGVIVYRYEESVLYPNSSLLNSTLVDYVKEHMRRGKDMSDVRTRDRPWNDPGPRHGKDPALLESEANKPLLRAIVLDFAMISHIDTTGVQALVDTRTEVERWAETHVEFHFANILSPWIARALIAGGFGVGASADEFPAEVAPVMHYSDLRGAVSRSQEQQPADEESALKQRGATFEQSKRVSDYGSTEDDSKPGSHSLGLATRPELLQYPDAPFFHLDLQTAVRIAELRASQLTRAYAGAEPNAIFGGDGPDRTGGALVSQQKL